jgi:hypothetical protein
MNQAATTAAAARNREAWGKAVVSRLGLGHDALMMLGLLVSRLDDDTIEKLFLDLCDKAYPAPTERCEFVLHWQDAVAVLGYAMSDVQYLKALRANQDRGGVKGLPV